MRRQRMRVDHGRHRIGGVVESVDELEAERHKQGQGQQQKWQIGGYRLAGIGDIGIEAGAGIDQPGGENALESHAALDRRLLLEVGLVRGVLMDCRVQGHDLHQCPGCLAMKGHGKGPDYSAAS